MLRPLAAMSLALTTLVACEEVVVDAPPPTDTAAAKPTARKPADPKMSPGQASRTFVAVKKQMEPIAEQECRARTQGVNCDYNIVIDDNPKSPRNAFQTLDRNGRPVIVFTMALIEDARNADEIAFVMGHEAAHHIRGHIERQERNATSTAIATGALTALFGGNSSAVQNATELGAQIGARVYSKDFELEADELGTILTIEAGYNPLKGAEFFNRIPDPGDKFLGTHPPNAKRISIVRRTYDAYLQSRS